MRPKEHFSMKEGKVLRGAFGFGSTGPCTCSDIIRLSASSLSAAAAGYGIRAVGMHAGR
jgi:hypothetical protein